MLLFVAVVALLAASATAGPIGFPHSQKYSYSEAVGSGSGTSYLLQGDGRITAVRVWERYNSYISGFQFSYNKIWSPLVGFKYNKAIEIELFDDEAIIQISGTYNHYVNSVAFFTNKGRSLFAGHPQGYTFNMYPTNNEAELSFISGRYHGSITSIGAHWAVVDVAKADYVKTEH